MMSHSNGSHASGEGDAAAAPRFFDVRVLRQDGPEQPSYWQRHRVQLEPDMNVTSVLQRIAAKAHTADGDAVAPVAYESNCLEEVCGSCTMLINGRTRQACSALVEKLLAEQPDEIELRPMSKFPVLRDLLVNRRRLFRALERVKAWIPVDGYYDAGPGPRQSAEQQEQAYPLMQCMSCGCCLEACPQYGKVELTRRAGEGDEAFLKREQAAYDANFVGAPRDQPNHLLQSASDWRPECGRSFGLADGAGGYPELRQRAELRRRLPQVDSPDHFDRTRRPGDHGPGVETLVRPLTLPEQSGVYQGSPAWQTQTASIPHFGRVKPG